MVIFFYLFASLAVISSIMVVTSRNPVFSVLWLIFAFCNGSGLMILLGAEFIAMMLIVIYVGAVAVLFLFVIMMLNIKLSEVQGALKKNLGVSSLVAVVMFCDLVIIILLGTKNINILPHVVSNTISNTHAIGAVLYTDFILPFQSAGLILFVAMISSIVLTMKPNLLRKRQNISQQLSKNKENSLEIVKLGVNQGVENIKYD